jgi:hypothetical protein
MDPRYNQYRQQHNQYNQQYNIKFNQANSTNHSGVSLTYLYQHYLNHPNRLYNLSYQDFNFLYTKWINENYYNDNKRNY